MVSKWVINYLQMRCTGVSYNPLIRSPLILTSWDIQVWEDEVRETDFGDWLGSVVVIFVKAVFFPSLCGSLHFQNVGQL